MRTTLALDDELVRIAQEFTGVAEKTALVREALNKEVEFTTRVGTSTLKYKFKLKDMVLNGKLEM